MLVAVGAARSSPGVTTACLAIAGCLERSVVIEGDPDGSVLAARFGLDREPNLASLAAGARLGLDAEGLRQHAQTLPGGVEVIVGLPADSAVALWRSAGSRLATSLAVLGSGAMVVVDAGRLTPTSPTGPLLETADMTVLVTRPILEDLHAVAHRLEVIGASTTHVAIVLVGDKPYGPREIGDRLGVDVLGVLADDRSTADALAGRSPRTVGRSVVSSPLARSARAVAEALLLRQGDPATPSPVEVVT